MAALCTLSALLVVDVAGAVLAAEQETAVSFDGLHRVEDSILEEAYVKPDLDLGGYQRIVIDPVVVSYKRRPTRRSTQRASGSTGNFLLTDSQMEELKTLFQDAFSAAMSKDAGWQVVEVAGPDVLRVHAELIDLVVKVPTAPSTGRRDFFVTEIGEVTMVLEVYDSQSGEILARGIDRRRIGRDRPTRAVEVTARSDVRRLFDGWAALLRLRLDQIRDFSSAPAD